MPPMARPMTSIKHRLEQPSEAVDPVRHLRVVIGGRLLQHLRHLAVAFARAQQAQRDRGRQGRRLQRIAQAAALRHLQRGRAAAPRSEKGSSAFAMPKAFVTGMPPLSSSPSDR